MRRGFTLVEILMVIVLIGIISSLFGFYVLEVVDAWVFASGQKGLAMTGRAGVYQVVREIRRADENESITTFTSQEVSFMDLEGESITYSQSGTSLLRNSDILVEDLQDPGGIRFTYLDGEGDQATSKEAIKTIRVRLILVKSDCKFVIESAANIRKRRL